MNSKRRAARGHKKQAIVRADAREVGKLLEPGERVSAVMPVELDWRRSTRGVRILLICVESVWVLWLALSLTSTSLRNDYLRSYVVDIVNIVLIVVAQVVAQLIAVKARRAKRRLALTDRRVILLRPAHQRWLWVSSQLVMEAADPLGRVRVDAVRPTSSRRYSFGLRREDGSTSELFFTKEWLPEVEWLASCLDAGVAAPRRPDALIA